MGLSNLLEKELKYELSKRDYLRLLKAFKPSRPKKLELINYYFDDPNLGLRKEKYALRIRTVHCPHTGQKHLLTLKYPAKQPRNAPKALKVRVEHEVEISSSLARKLLNQKATILDLDLKPIRILVKKFSRSQLLKVKPLGLIETRRTVIPFARRFEIELDRCKIYNKKFYEVEVETSQPRRADSAIKELLEAHGIPYLPITRSKFARFIEEWKRRHY